MYVITTTMLSPPEETVYTLAVGTLGYALSGHFMLMEQQCVVLVTVLVLKIVCKAHVLQHIVMHHFFLVLYSINIDMPHFTYSLING